MHSHHTSLIEAGACHTQPLALCDMTQLKLMKYDVHAWQWRRVLSMYYNVRNLTNETSLTLCVLSKGILVGQQDMITIRELMWTLSHYSDKICFQCNLANSVFQPLKLGFSCNRGNRFSVDYVGCILHPQGVMGTWGPGHHYLQFL